MLQLSTWVARNIKPAGDVRAATVFQSLTSSVALILLSIWIAPISFALTCLVWIYGFVTGQRAVTPTGAGPKVLINGAKVRLADSHIYLSILMKNLDV